MATFLTTAVRSFSSSTRHVAIVGSGPAGFYAAQQVLKHPDVQIDVYERLPAPFGLVRYGVAPDHPDVKNVEATFTKVAKNPRVRFVGNVSVGQDVKVSELRSNYHSVLLAYGAAKDRTLNVKGEGLKNVLSARNFVGFYNGLPEDTNLDVRLDCHDTAVVVGLGNVALDVARVLLTPVDVLKNTDMTEAALEKLHKSTIKRVHVVGRRGPLQVAFTIKEFREMLHLPACQPHFNSGDFQGLKEMVPKLKRPRKRLTELLAKAALDPPTQKQLDAWGPEMKTHWHLDLLRRPLEIHPDSSLKNVAGITLGINKLVGQEWSEGQEIEETDKREFVECGLILRSIGYKSVRVESGIPYDDQKGIVPNVDGKVEPGLYCAGWLATGPRGVIVDTMNEAFKVGQILVEDLLLLNDTDTEKAGYEVIEKLFQQRKVQPVDFKDWEQIDAKEKLLGEHVGKPREKITDVQAMVDVVHNKHN